MLYMLEKDYFKTINMPKQIVKKYKNINVAYKHLLEFATNRKLTGLNALPKVYSLKMTNNLNYLKHQSYPFCIGDVDYNVEANSIAHCELDSFRKDQHKAIAYWSKIVRLTDPSRNGKAILSDEYHTKINPLNKLKYDVLVERPFSYDYLRPLTKTDVIKISRLITKMAKATYKPVNEYDYSLIVINNKNGYTVITKNDNYHKQLHINSLTDIMDKYHVLDSKVLLNAYDIKRVNAVINAHFSKLYNNIKRKKQNVNTVNLSAI